MEAENAPAVVPPSRTDRFADILGGEVVHEVRAGGEMREARESGRGRSVAAPQPAAARLQHNPTAMPPGLAVLQSTSSVLQPAPIKLQPGPAAAAYLGAARYVAGTRIDTSLFRPIPFRTHQETTTVGSGAARVDWAAKYLR